VAWSTSIRHPSPTRLLFLSRVLLSPPLAPSFPRALSVLSSNAADVVAAAIVAHNLQGVVDDLQDLHP